MRLAWARDHVTWTQNDWAPVLFTDESRFCVDFTDRRARVWRMSNERFAPVCVHAWDMLQTAVSSRPVQPASVQELRQALLEEWDQIPQYKIRRLISSMRRRCQAVIEARGHHTRY